MKRIISALMLAMVAVCVNAQSFNVYIQDSEGQYTNIRNAPGGKVVKRLVTGIYALCVRNVRNGWWEIVPNTLEDVESQEKVSMNDEKSPCFIHYSAIAVATRNYDGRQLYLRKLPDGKAAVEFSFGDEKELRPLKIKNGWVKVRTLDKKHTGWIEEEWLCGNPVTNCS
ncbi:hypothetical protein [Prevotella sp. OH937_COT-195]|uniref:hypothetical protein n=1 Tax=Prevotella sp. OH937_COT-195 TaxID=2491051 RepID=UPI000F645489|nr:hypothetical protein [Prevotella sp. OH937_COT-195]RRC98456.1 hypothetical protein EII32_09095 [Prevotella sp. OH937_COT-195]